MLLTQQHIDHEKQLIHILQYGVGYEYGKTGKIERQHHMHSVTGLTMPESSHQGLYSWHHFIQASNFEQVIQLTHHILILGHHPVQALQASNNLLSLSYYLQLTLMSVQQICHCRSCLQQAIDTVQKCERSSYLICICYPQQLCQLGCDTYMLANGRICQAVMQTSAFR